MTTRTTTRTIRLDSDIADWLKGKDARLILESCCELVQAGKLKLDDGGVHTMGGANPRALEEENEALKRTVEFLKASESVHTISDKAMECAKEVNSILAFYEADEDVFWSDLLDKVTNGDMSSGTLKLDGGVLYSASRKEEVAPILANLERLCFDRGINTEEAYEKVLSVGAKITYKDIQGASIG